MTPCSCTCAEACARRTSGGPGQTMQCPASLQNREAHNSLQKKAVSHPPGQTKTASSEREASCARSAATACRLVQHGKFYHAAMAGCRRVIFSQYDNEIGSTSHLVERFACRGVTVEGPAVFIRPLLFVFAILRFVFIVVDEESLGKGDESKNGSARTSTEEVCLWLSRDVRYRDGVVTLSQSCQRRQ